MSISRGELAAELARTHGIDEGAVAQAVEVYAGPGQLDGGDGDLSAGDAEHIRGALAAQMAVDAGVPLDDVAEATRELRALQEDVEDADRVWRAAIRGAVAAGQRVVDVAAAAGVSRERVYQIRDGRR